MKAGWTEVALGDVARIDRRSVTAAGIAEGTLYVGLEDIDAGGGAVRPHPVRAGELGSNKFVFDSQHILYGKLRPYLAKIASAPGSGICSTDILPIRPTGVDRAFLLHFLRQPAMVGHAAARSSGANLPRLAPTELEKFRLPLPPLEEQKRIAAILDKADELQAKRRAAITHLDSLTQAIFLDMFGDRITRTQSGPREPLAGLVVRPLRNGAYFEQDRYRTGDAGVEMVHMSDAFGGVVSTGELRRVDVSAAELDRYGLTSNDLLVARRSLNFAGSAKPCRIPDLESTGPLIYESSLIRVSPDSSVLDVSYLYGLLANEEFRRREILPFVTGATISGISQSNLAKVEIPTPPLEDQIRFAQRADSIVRKSTLFCNHRDVLSDLVSSVQARAFRGEL